MHGRGQEVLARFCYTTFMKILSQSLSDTARVAGEFLASLRPKDTATVIALEGDLGAGKTAFTQEVGKILGIDHMHSPTFVIEKIYDIDFNGFQKLIHIDAYRLEKTEELLHLGWEDILRDPKHLIFIEWPERVASIIPPEAIKISLAFIDESVREIHLHEEKD